MAVKHVQTWVMMGPSHWFPVLKRTCRWQCVGDQFQMVGNSRMGRSSSFHVFFLLLGFNPHVQLILIDIPWWLPGLPSIRNSCANSFEIGNNGNNPFPDHQSMEPAINGLELSNLSDFWILIPIQIHRTSDPHRMERMQQIRLHLTMFDCVSLGRRRWLIS